ncbi:MAG: alpha/beta fold hydrolase [Pseudomonadales bacterium]|nr:alpha/beta fold hydrolase [Pseudomonadales bacterium]
MTDFSPPRLLRSPHLQTLIGSRGRRHWVNARARDLLVATERHSLTTEDGVTLEVWLSRQHLDAPTVILLHGWLGHADSSYLLSAAAQLWHAGFSVARLNLRDHGDTAHLNREMFHSARIQEVVEAVRQIESVHATGPCGLAGFSLGGNFALRVARAHPLPTIAVCPAMDPAVTMRQIDSGWAGYRLFFVRKWHRALRAKQQAFPGDYSFDQALRLRTVSELTDLFVSQQTDYPSTQAYFDAYSLTGNALQGIRATIVYAEDDPVIPCSGFLNLPDTLHLTRVARGGHCAFVERLNQPAWIDRLLTENFSAALLPEAETGQPAH